MKFLMLTFAFFMHMLKSQDGHIRLGFQRHLLRDEEGDNGGGGGAGGDKGDKKDPPGEGDKGGKPGASGDKGGEGDDENLDDSEIEKLPKGAQALIKKLRKENAAKRTEANNLKTKNEKYEKAFKIISGDDEEEDPEVKLGKVQNQNQSLQVKNAMLEMALENGIGPKDRKYFEFLMAEALEELEEGEELSEEKLAEVVAAVKGKGGGTPANTGTKGDGGSKGGDKKPAGDTDGVTLEQFVGMTVTQKSKLYNEKPEVYNTLMAQARAKKLI
jgi:hypothetical protein